MFCTECGKEIKEGSGFCTECGARVEPAAAQKASVPPRMAEAPVYEEGHRQEQPAAAESSVSFTQAVRLYFMNYANFHGRAARAEYWWAFLFNFLVSFVAAQIPYVGSVCTLVLLIPGLSVGIRRLHDTGKSWVYILINLIPVVGTILYLVQLCKESDGDNQWGSGIR